MFLTQLQPWIHIWVSGYQAFSWCFSDSSVPESIFGYRIVKPSRDVSQTAPCLNPYLVIGLSSLFMMFLTQLHAWLHIWVSDYQTFLWFFSDGSMPVSIFGYRVIKPSHDVSHTAPCLNPYLGIGLSSLLMMFLRQLRAWIHIWVSDCQAFSWCFSDSSMPESIFGYRVIKPFHDVSHTAPCLTPYLGIGLSNLLVIFLRRLHACIHIWVSGYQAFSWCFSHSSLPESIFGYRVIKPSHDVSHTGPCLNPY